MINRSLGLHNLESALKEYLMTRGFDIIIFVKSLNAPEFLTPEMEQRFQSIVRRQSIDPQAQNTGRTSRTFVPRRERNSSESPNNNPQISNSAPQNSPSSPSESQNTSPAASTAAQTAVEVTNAANNSEQSFLDLFCTFKKMSKIRKLV
ncbi:MAG: hypothetical protein Q4G69_06755 [Planctomycetia bacterium]|nr:hypothetical protein [Planctomycetia bacterium]